MMPPPDRRSFVDNRDGNTVAGALRSFAAYSANHWPIAIASGYFDLGGFDVIADTLEAAPSVRILLGTEPPTPPRRSVSLPGQPPSPPAEAAEATITGITTDRNILPFTRHTAASLARLLTFLERPTTEVRIY